MEIEILIFGSPKALVYLAIFTVTFYLALGWYLDMWDR